MSKLYEYSDAPSLPKAIIDKANRDIPGHHEHRLSIDTDFVLGQYEAQVRVEIERMKMRFPGEEVYWPSREHAIAAYYPQYNVSAYCFYGRL